MQPDAPPPRSNSRTLAIIGFALGVLTVILVVAALL